MPKADAIAELAGKMVQALKERREQGAEGYPLPVTRLAAVADPQATPEQIAKALARKPFAAQMLAAHKKCPDSPVALTEDIERLAASPLLLDFALGQVCTAEKPLHPLASVVGKVDKALRPAFETALQRRLAENTLPDTAGVLVVRGKPHFYLKRLPPPKPPAAGLAEKMMRVLEERRGLGEGAYPLPLKQLQALADPAARPALLKKAIAEVPFRSQALPAVPGKVDAPVVLAADRDLLAGSAVLLEYLLGAVCKAQKPLAPLVRLKALLVPELRQPFEEVVHRRLAESNLPSGVGHLAHGQDVELYRLGTVPESLALAVKLLRALEGQRRQGGGDYPPTLGRLLQQADPAAPPELVRKAVAEKAFKPHVVLALPNNLESPLALAGDDERLADSPVLLELALVSARTSENQVVPLADVAKKIAKDLQPRFREAIGRRLEGGSLPPAVGCLRIKGRPHLFLLEDVNGTPPGRPRASPQAAKVAPPAPAPVVQPLAFGQLFDEAFERLDREGSAANLVNLVGLRRAVPADRAAFDAGLHQLRRAGRYTLSGAEGRHGISPEERAAGIVEDGALLLFVSRKAP